MREPVHGPAARGQLRAGHADRNASVAILQAAFVQGMLAKDEFDQRVGQALTARTYAELAAVTADLPARPLARDACGPGPAGAGSNRLPVAACLILATILLAGSIVGGPLMFLAVAQLYIIGLLVAVTEVISRHRSRRTAGSRTPAPGQP